MVLLVVQLERELGLQWMRVLIVMMRWRRGRRMRWKVCECWVYLMFGRGGCC